MSISVLFNYSGMFQGSFSHVGSITMQVVKHKKKGILKLLLGYLNVLGCFVVCNYVFYYSNWVPYNRFCCTSHKNVFSMHKIGL